MIADLIFAIGAVIFALALIPSVRSTHKPSVWTSLVTGTVLTVFAVTYFSIGLVFAAITTAASAILWFILLYQAARVE